MIRILTGEYPPQGGGVGDYSALVAAALAAEGEVVDVWAPGLAPVSLENGATVYRECGTFSPADLRRIDRLWSHGRKPSRVIVQWTPHSFGYRSLNALVPAWLWKRAHIDNDQVELMIHEPFLAFGEGNRRQDVAAAGHRLMMAMLLRAAAKVWVSIPAWEEQLRPWLLGAAKDFEWLPVPSNIDTACNPRRVLEIRSALAPHRQPLIGHFGTYRPAIAMLLAPALVEILRKSNANLLLAGSGSHEFCFELLRSHPEFANRIAPTGTLSPTAVAEHLSACDVLLQPYPDGISTRRGTAMAAIALGLPIVTNLGRLSENIWRESGAVRLAASTQPELLALRTLELVSDRDVRLQTSALARELYRDRFEIGRTLAALLGRKPVPHAGAERAAVA